jgi:hypothetical protein
MLAEAFPGYEAPLQLKKKMAHHGFCVDAGNKFYNGRR